MKRPRVNCTYGHYITMPKGKPSVGTHYLWIGDSKDKHVATVGGKRELNKLRRMIDRIFGEEK